MKIFKTIFIFLTFHCNFLLGNVLLAADLSSNARVSLVTIAPGPALYSTWGHAVLRIYDPAQNMDRAYNYGSFTSTVDHFYLRFLQGTLPFKLSVTDFNAELSEWKSENRSVSEQVLNLYPAQKQALFEALETNALPQNREYIYQFYYDNCTTKPRDLLKMAAGNNLKFRKPEVPTQSYRDWMNKYLGDQPWAKFGANLALGMPADRVATVWESMYLPDNLREELNKAIILQEDQEAKPFVSEEAALFIAAPANNQQNPLLDPNFVITAVSITLLSLSFIPGSRFSVSRYIDILIFGIAGIAGWVLLLLWLATDHGVTAWNPALLWLMPLHFPFALFNWSAKNTRIYFGVNALLILSGLMLSNIPGIADLAFGMLLLIRCLVRVKQARRFQLPESHAI